MGRRGRTGSGERCFLFFPASRPEMLEKARRSGADGVWADLEDAVEPEAKEAARDALHGLLNEAAGGEAPLSVRINHPSTVDGARDLELLGSCGERLHRVVVPKVAGPADVRSVRDAFARSSVPGVVATIESIKGLSNIDAIASSESVAALFFGALDLSLELGCALEWEPLLYARGRCVVAAARSGLPLIDAPFFDVRDPDGLAADAARARKMGFTAKAAIHPAQVPPIKAAFAPTTAELDRARRIVAEADASQSGAFLLDGVMIDRPVIAAARRLIDSASPLEE